MCWCNPSIRTPCCGGVDCHPSTLDTIVYKDQVALLKEEILKELSLLLKEGTRIPMSDIKIIEDVIKNVVEKYRCED